MAHRLLPVRSCRAETVARSKGRDCREIEGSRLSRKWRPVCSTATVLPGLARARAFSVPGPAPGTHSGGSRWGTARHGGSRRFTAGLGGSRRHGGSRQITADHGSSRRVTAGHSGSHRHGGSRRVTAGHGGRPIRPTDRDPHQTRVAPSPAEGADTGTLPGPLGPAQALPAVAAHAAAAACSGVCCARAQLPVP
jgi:hypothetical protein